MSAEQFPLTRAAGLRVEYTERYLEPPTAVVRASDVERLLRDAPVVGVWPQRNEPEHFYAQTWKDGDTAPRTGRLLLFPETKPDTAEILLRELVVLCEQQEIGIRTFTRVDLSGIYDRARKLLGKG